MIHYHGTPISGSTAVAARVLMSRFAFVSYARPDQLPLVLDYAAGFALDNGAFTFWRQGKDQDWDLYRSWVIEMHQHPAYQFALTPDSITGGEEANDQLLKDYPLPKGVPVFHQGETMARLMRLRDNYEMVALGSVEHFLPTETFHNWMSDCMEILCDKDGRPRTRIHGLRMLQPEIFERYPFASADSTNLGQNCNTPSRWSGRYNPIGPEVRALVLRDRIESFQGAQIYKASPYRQLTLEI